MKNNCPYCNSTSHQIDDCEVYVKHKSILIEVKAKRFSAQLKSTLSKYSMEMNDKTTKDNMAEDVFKLLQTYTQEDHEIIVDATPEETDKNAFPRFYVKIKNNNNNSVVELEKFINEYLQQ